MTTPRLTLRPKRDKRVRSGHPWIFSNELEAGFASLEPGAMVDVFDAKGAFVGRGLVSPQSLIAVRLYSRRRHDDLESVLFWEMRLREALAYRNAVYAGRNDLRLVHAEGDWLPGLIIDRFGPHLAVQINTVGIEVRKPIIAEAIQKALAPESAVLRNDNRVRTLEGLELGREVWFGDPPESIDIDENGVKFRVSLLGGQKTGHFYDQADNRAFAGSLCKGRKVLDVYSNSGGFALQALRQGAISATTIDKSEPNAERALENATLNGFDGKLESVQGDGNAFLEEQVAMGARYGAVVLDPPAFAKTRKTAGNALRGYTNVNALGMTLVEPEGFLFTSSCSHHVHEDRFLEAMDKAAKVAGRVLRIVKRGEQAADHPVLPGVPETRYLKFFAFQVRIG